MQLEARLAGARRTRYRQRDLRLRGHPAELDPAGAFWSAGADPVSHGGGGPGRVRKDHAAEPVPERLDLERELPAVQVHVNARRQTARRPAHRHHEWPHQRRRPLARGRQPRAVRALLEREGASHDSGQLTEVQESPRSGRLPAIEALADPAHAMDSQIAVVKVPDDG